MLLLFSVAAPPAAAPPHPSPFIESGARTNKTGSRSKSLIIALTQFKLVQDEIVTYVDNKREMARPKLFDCVVCIFYIHMILGYQHPQSQHYRTMGLSAWKVENWISHHWWRRVWCSTGRTIYFTRST